VHAAASSPNRIFAAYLDVQLFVPIQPHAQCHMAARSPVSAHLQWSMQVFWDTRNPEYKPVFSNYGGKTVGAAGC
jgi:hypothetical protein